ncbi:MAG: MFS transporter [Chloroflexota bacterium]
MVQRVSVGKPEVGIAGGPDQELSSVPAIPADAADPAIASATGETAARRPRLLEDERFRAFWLARVCAASAHGALIYAFLLLVADMTDRAAFTSLFVICAIVPSILFGLPAGVVADQFPLRAMLSAVDLLRFAFVLVLVIHPPGLPGIFAATLGLWTLQQFHSPAESAALVQLAPRSRLTEAQSLFNLAATVAQVLGLVILAPLLLRTAGPQALFAACAALFFIAAGLALLLPPLDGHLAARSGQAVPQILRDGLRGIRSDAVTMRAMAADVLVGIGMSALLVIMPLYLRRVLETGADNTVFVFAPAALGLVAGLRLAAPLGRLAGEQRVATGAMLGFAACVGALAFVADIRHVANDVVGLPLDRAADALRIPSPVLLTMLISIPAGLCSAMVGVASRALLLAHTPPGRRGQTMATVTLLTAVGALLPTLLAGVAADAFGVERIAVGIAVAIALSGLAVHLAARPMRTAAVSVPALEAGESR